MDSVLNGALYIRARRYCVHRYPARHYLDEFVHGPKGFHVSEVPLYLYRVNQRCNQSSS